jgi:hypothetical protein
MAVAIAFALAAGALAGRIRQAGGILAHVFLLMAPGLDALATPAIAAIC